MEWNKHLIVNFHFAGGVQQNSFQGAGGYPAQPAYHGGAPVQQPGGYAPQPAYSGQPGGFAPQPGYQQGGYQQPGGFQQPNGQPPIVNNYIQPGAPQQSSSGSGLQTALLAGVGGLALYGALKPSEEKTIIIHQGDQSTQAPAAAAIPAVAPAVNPAPAVAVANPAPVAAVANPAPVGSVVNPAPVAPAAIPQVPLAPIPDSTPVPMAADAAQMASANPVPLAPMPPATNDNSTLVPLAPLPDASNVPLAPLPVMVNPCQPDQNGTIPLNCSAPVPQAVAGTEAPPLIHHTAAASIFANNTNNTTNTTIPDGRGTASTICLFHASIYSILVLVLGNLL